MSRLRRPARLLRGSVAALVVAASLAACGGTGSGGSTAPNANVPGSSAAVFSANEIAPWVAGIVHKSVKPLPITRLAPGLVPPTNRWFSGLVFGAQPQPVFPLPLSFGLTGSGFAFGTPKVTTSAKTISGGFQPDITVDAGAKSSRVSAYDTLTVTLESLDSQGKVLGHTLIAQGSPFVRYTAATAGDLALSLPLTQTGNVWTLQAGGTTYGLVLQHGSVQAQRVHLDAGGTATWFPVPAGGSADALAGLAGHPVTGSGLDYQVSGDQASTTLSYRADGDTAFAVLPHQQAGLARDIACDLGTYPSIYGTLKLCRGQQLTYQTPVTPAAGQLDLSRVSGSDRDQLTTQVRKDIAALPPFPADTYFGGKSLYRAAMLYRLARQLKADDAAAQVKAKLTDTLGQWTDPQGCAKRPAFCFVYDEQAKGVVGLTPSFGSDEFNDHHFHYGYFLYAAGVLASDDPQLASRWAPVMNLLAADLASSASNGAFPDLRVFDAYAGHSWASGTSPFADGNNQESSSEAVNAWVGLALWAKASQNEALGTEATWLLSNEAASTKAYWTNVDTSQPVYSGFGHRILSLNWGGKRDYATWFSPAPAAVLGIQLIPMNPSAGYLGGDPARIEANVAEATGGSYNQKFGDYLLMYDALAGEKQRQAALATAEKLDGKWIDDGDSRSYLLAWLMSART